MAAGMAAIYAWPGRWRAGLTELVEGVVIGWCDEILVLVEGHSYLPAGSLGPLGDAGAEIVFSIQIRNKSSGSDGRSSRHPLAVGLVLSGDYLILSLVANGGTPPVKFFLNPLNDVL